MCTMADLFARTEPLPLRRLLLLPCQCLPLSPEFSPPIEGRVVSVPSNEAIDEKIHLDKKATEILQDGDPVIVTETKSGNSDDSDSGADDAIIVTGADAAKHLLPLRDDLEPALTFRSLFLATILSAFQAVMNQIYYVSTVQYRVIYTGEHGTRVPCPSQYQQRLTTLLVQTDGHHHPRNLYRHHSLLSR